MRPDSHWKIQNSFRGHVQAASSYPERSSSQAGPQGRIGIWKGNGVVPRFCSLPSPTEYRVQPVEGVLVEKGSARSRNAHGPVAGREDDERLPASPRIKKSSSSHAHFVVFSEQTSVGGGSVGTGLPVSNSRSGGYSNNSLFRSVSPKPPRRPRVRRRVM